MLKVHKEKGEVVVVTIDYYCILVTWSSGGLVGYPSPSPTRFCNNTSFYLILII